MLAHIRFHSPVIRRLLFIIVASLAVAAASAGGYLAYKYAVHDNGDDANRDGNRNDSGAVVTNGIECSQIGRYVLEYTVIFEAVGRL